MTGKGSYDRKAACPAAIDTLMPAATLRTMARPTPIQVVQIAVLSVVISVGVSVVFGLVVYGFTVVAGMWTDRPS